MASYDGEEWISFKTLWERSEHIGRYILANFQGKRPVAIYGDKEVDMLSCMVAAVKSGHPYVCVPSFYPQEKIDALLEDSKAQLVLNPARTPIHDVPMKVLRHDEIRTLGKEYGDYDRIPEENYVKPEETLCIMYTSGSTGKPKGVTVTLANIEEEIKQSEEIVSRSIPEDKGVMVNLSAYSFAAGLITVYYVLFKEGCTVYGVPRTKMSDQNELLAFIEEANPHLFNCTPTMIERFLNSERFSPEYLPNLSYSCLGGEPLSTETARKYKERFPDTRLLNGMGTTETLGTPLVCEITDELLDSDEPYYPIGTADTPYAYVVDENGVRSDEDRTTGELIISCRAVVPGYLDRPDQTESVFFTDYKGDWSYRTRDIVKLKNGFVYYVGRKDNQVKIGGNRVELEDVESNLRLCSNVAACAAGVKREKDGHGILVAFVVQKDSSVKKMAALLSIKQELKTRVESHMIPTKIVFVDSLPKNINLKLDRAKINRMIEEM